MIRTLLDRCDSIVTKPEDRKTEEEHVHNALKRCGYPDWAFKRVKEQRALTPEERKQKKGEKQTQRSLGQVSLPYVAGLSEAYACITPNSVLYEAFQHAETKFSAPKGQERH